MPAPCAHNCRETPGSRSLSQFSPWLYRVPGAPEEAGKGEKGGQIQNLSSVSWAWKTSLPNIFLVTWEDCPSGRCPHSYLLW